MQLIRRSASIGRVYRAHERLFLWTRYARLTLVLLLFFFFFRASLLRVSPYSLGITPLQCIHQAYKAGRVKITMRNFEAECRVMSTVGHAAPGNKGPKAYLISGHSYCSNLILGFDAVTSSGTR